LGCAIRAEDNAARERLCVHVALNVREMPSSPEELASGMID
jgi:hypothetical protein